MRESESSIAADQGGFSLVELIAGVAITVMLIAGAMTGVATHQAQRRVYGERVLAMSACRSMLEKLRSVDILDLPSYHGRGFDVRGQNGQPRGLNPQPGDADELPGEITVIADRTSGAVTVYRVTARVRWQGVSRGGELTMSALMGDRR